MNAVPHAAAAGIAALAWVLVATMRPAPPEPRLHANATAARDSFLG